MNYDPITHQEALKIRADIAAVKLAIANSVRAGRMLQYAAVAQSRNTVIQFDGLLDVLAIAGHGSGAACGGSGNRYATGASTGELAIALKIPVKRGDVVTSTIGAGGAAVVGASANVSGNAGGDTTVVLPGGRTIIVKGGRGGLAGTALPLVAPRGGYGGTGGDLHVEGGPGGSILATTSSFAVTGSGAVGLLLTPPAERAGGDINTPGGTGWYSGGAGVGGKGGSLLAAQSGVVGPTGGGAGGPGQDITTTGVPTLRGPNLLGEQLGTSPVALVQSIASMWCLDYFGGGSGPSTVDFAGPGGGGAASGSNANVASSGVFAGPGGFYMSVSGTAGKCAGWGPGGSIACSAANQTMTSTAGHPGLVILVVREG